MTAGGHRRYPCDVGGSMQFQFPKPTYTPSPTTLQHILISLIFSASASSSPLSKLSFLNSTFMASTLSPLDQDYTIEDVPVIDGSLLMCFLEEPHVDEIQDERLGSLEAEIDRSLIMPNCGLDNVELVDGEDCSTSMSHVDDPFDWVDIDMVSDSHYGDMGNWYLDTCMDEIGMAGYEDGRDYSNMVYYGEGCMEQMCSPLWEDA